MSEPIDRDALLQVHAWATETLRVNEEKRVKQEVKMQLLTSMAKVNRARAEEFSARSRARSLESIERLEASVNQDIDSVLAGCKTLKMVVAAEERTAVSRAWLDKLERS